jgi:replicative DNA helicase
MIQLAEKRHAIDTVTLMEDLSSHGVLEASGGVAYISQLADGLPRVTNVEHYARIVKEKAVLRSLIHSAAAIQEQALAAGDDADTILDRAENAIFQLAEDRVRTGPDRHQGSGPGRLRAPRENIQRGPPHHRARHGIRRAR